MTTENLELLKVYLESDQTDETLKSRLNSEPELAEAWAKLKLLSEGFQRETVRDKIKAIHAVKMAEWSSGKVVEFKPVRKGLWKTWASVSAAASIAVVLYLGNAQFSLPKELGPSERSAGEEISNAFTDIFNKYKEAQTELRNGDYEQAALHFSEVNSRKGDIRQYYIDAATWYEVVALSEINESLASEKMDALELQEDFKYPVSFLERLKMKVRLLF